MAGVVPAIPRLKFTDSAGNPIALGWLTVYLAGTTTKANSWQDRAQTALNTNPIHLDANGEALVWLDPAANHKFLLQDSDLATVPGWPVDNIVGTPTDTTAVPIRTVDTFSGTGAAQTLTLSVTPASKTETDVYVGGDHQAHGTYTLAGNQILGTFTAGSANVEVVTTSVVDTSAFLADLSAFAQSAGNSATAAATSAAAAAASATNASGFAAQAASIAAAIGAGGSFLEKVHVHDYSTFGVIATIPDTVNAVTKVYFGSLFIGPDLGQYTPATPTANQVTLAADLGGVTTVYIFYI